MSKCYIGRCKCGNIVAALVANSRPQEETAQIVGQWYLDGLHVETLDTDEVRVQLFKCKCEDVPDGT